MQAPGDGGSTSHISYRYDFGEPERLESYADRTEGAALQASTFETTISRAMTTTETQLSGFAQAALKAQLVEREAQVNDAAGDLRSYADAVREFASDVRSFRRALWDVRDHARGEELTLDHAAEHVLFPSYEPPTAEGTTQAEVDAYTAERDRMVDAFWRCHRMREAAQVALDAARADLRDAVARFAKNDDDRDYDPDEDRYRRRFREYGREPEGRGPGGPGGGGPGGGGPGGGGPGGGDPGGGDPGDRGPGDRGPGGRVPGGRGPGDGGPGDGGPRESTEQDRRELVEKIRDQMTVDRLLGGVAGEGEHGVEEGKPALRWDRESQSWQLTERAIRAIEAENQQAADAWRRSGEADAAYEEARAANELANDELSAAIADGDGDLIAAAQERADAAYERAEAAYAERNAAERTALAEQAEADRVNASAQDMLEQADVAGDGPGRAEGGASPSQPRGTTR